MKNTQDLIKPLNFFIASIALIIIDISYTYTRNGEGITFDFFPDILGVLILIWFIRQLQTISFKEDYTDRFSFFIKILFVFAVFVVLDFWVIDKNRMNDFHQFMAVARSLFNVLLVFAILRFTKTMQEICISLQYENTASLWNKAWLATLILYLIPNIVLSILDILGRLAGTVILSFHIYNTPAAILFFVVFMLPCIIMVFAAYKMKIECKKDPKTFLHRCPLCSKKGYYISTSKSLCKSCFQKGLYPESE